MYGKKEVRKGYPKITHAHKDMYCLYNVTKSHVQTILQEREQQQGQPKIVVTIEEMLEMLVKKLNLLTALDKHIVLDIPVDPKPNQIDIEDTSMVTTMTVTKTKLMRLYRILEDPLPSYNLLVSRRRMASQQPRSSITDDEDNNNIMTMYRKDIFFDITSHMLFLCYLAELESKATTINSKLIESEKVIMIWDWYARIIYHTFETWIPSMHYRQITSVLAKCLRLNGHYAQQQQPFFVDFSMFEERTTSSASLTVIEKDNEDICGIHNMNDPKFKRFMTNEVMKHFIQLYADDDSVEKVVWCFPYYLQWRHDMKTTAKYDYDDNEQFIMRLFIPFFDINLLDVLQYGGKYVIMNHGHLYAEQNSLIKCMLNEWRIRTQQYDHQQNIIIAGLRSIHTQTIFGNKEYYEKIFKILTPLRFYEVILNLIHVNKEISRCCQKKLLLVDCRHFNNNDKREQQHQQLIRLSTIVDVVSVGVDDKTPMSMSIASNEFEINMILQKYNVRKYYEFISTMRFSISNEQKKMIILNFPPCIAYLLITKCVNRGLLSHKERCAMEGHLKFDERFVITAFLRSIGLTQTETSSFMAIAMPNRKNKCMSEKHEYMKGVANIYSKKSMSPPACKNMCMNKKLCFFMSTTEVEKNQFLEMEVLPSLLMITKQKHEHHHQHLPRNADELKQSILRSSIDGGDDDHDGSNVVKKRKGDAIEQQSPISQSQSLDTNNVQKSISLCHSYRKLLLGLQGFTTTDNDEQKQSIFSSPIQYFEQTMTSTIKF